MKKIVSKILALALTASLLLTACGTSSNDEGTTSGDNSTEQTTESTGDESESTGEEIKDLVIPKLATREIQTFDILYSQSFNDLENLTNLTDPLLEVDNKGQIVACLADEWGTEDNGLNWTFHIREGVKWVDVNGNEKADVTSYDFATGMEWVLNFYKNESSHTSQPFEMIAGAEEYYEYTKTLTEEEAYALTADDDSVFQQMVGIKTPDANTIVYTCTAEKPYFDTMATWAGMYPRAQAMVDELGGPDGVKSMNNENMWYNGAYTMTSYVQGNEKVFTKNPAYWDTECQRFDTVTIKMVESNDIAFQLYQSGELDYCDLTESQIATISSNPNNEYYDYLVETRPANYSYQIRFNYAKNNEDGTPDTNWNLAAANEAFRLSWYYGLDLTPYYSRTNAVNPLSCENNYYSMPGLLYTSDGTDYTDLVKAELGLGEADGEKMIRLNSELGEQYKQQAIEELTALGVTFPVGIDYYISGSNQTALDSATVLAQCFSDSLGDDYVQLNIKTYVSSASQEVYEPKLQSINISGWGADYGDPQNYLGQETAGNDTAYYTRTLSNVNDLVEDETNADLLAAYREFTALVEAADAINDDLDARYEAFAKAEAYLIQHALTIPNYYNVGWILTKINPYSKMKAMYGIQNNKMKNWETSMDGYTAEEMAAFEEAYNNRTAE